MIFDSHFESGNLRKAIKVSDNEYNLLLDVDTETTSYTQWYYFSVFNPAKGFIKFNILNFMKNESLYNEGMKPVVWSKIKYDKAGLGWHVDGLDIRYFSNKKNGYTLTFTHHFAYASDTVYFAMCYPYTYTELQNYLKKLSETHTSFLRVDPL